MSMTASSVLVRSYGSGGLGPVPAASFRVIVVSARSVQQLADARDDLVAVQLDVCHELIVRHARYAVFEVEPGGFESAEVGGDLLGHGFGGSDAERSVRPGFPVERLLRGDGEPALWCDQGNDVQPARPELGLRLCVG